MKDWSIKVVTNPVFALLFAAVTIWSFMVPDAVGFQQPAFARIFFWHFPCPILAFSLMTVALWFSFKALTTKDRTWDIRASAAMDLSMILVILTLASGILFSKVQWGAWWQQDPRQTSYLLVCLIYAAYLVLRTSIADPDVRAKYAAGYAIAAYLPAQFLTFVFPRLEHVAKQSFHPTTSIMQGQIKGAYAQVIISVLVLVTLLVLAIYRLRVKAGLLEYQLELNNGRLEISGSDPTRPTVVRPVPVSREGL